MSMSIEELDLYMEMVAVENLIGEVVLAESFGDLSLYDQESIAAGENASREELEMTEDLIDAAVIPASARMPVNSGIPTLVEVVSFTKWLGTNEDFISIEGYSSDDESKFCEDDSGGEGQMSVSSEDSLPTEELELIDVVQIVSTELVEIETGGSYSNESPGVPEYHKPPLAWNYTRTLASPKHPKFSKTVELLPADGMKAKVNELIPMLEREQELRAKLFARRATTPATPRIAPPAFVHPALAVSKRQLPSSSGEHPFKKVKTFHDRWIFF